MKNHSFHYGNPQVFRLFIISALVIIFIRLLCPIEITWDDGIQIDMAYRWFHGLGLTSTYFSAEIENINQPPIPQYSTWFPPGFSLVVGCFLKLGFSLTSCLKMIYAPVTLVGWLAWGVIASRLMTRPILIKNFVLPAHLIVAAISPILFTPFWISTDIITWAGTPLVFLLLSNTSQKTNIKSKEVRERAYDNLAFFMSGFLIGILYTFRYASLFLVVTGFLILFKDSFPSVKLFIKRFILFISGMVIIFVPVFTFNHLVSKQNKYNSLPPYADLSKAFTHLNETFNNISDGLLNIPGMLLIPDLDWINLYLRDKFFGQSIWIVWTMIIFVLPLLSILFGENKKLDSEVKIIQQKELATSLLLIPLSLCLFLTIPMFVSKYNFLGDRRHFLPVGLSIIYLFYGVIALSKKIRFSRLFFTLFILMFLTYKLVYQPIAGKLPLSTIIGHSKHPNISYVSNEVFSRYRNSSSFLINLYNENPSAIFYAHFQPLFQLYFVGLNTIRVIPDNKFWKTAYTTQETKIFWVISENCPYICSPRNDQMIQSIETISKLPSFDRLIEFPEERVTIFSSDLPAGYVFNGTGF